MRSIKIGLGFTTLLILMVCFTAYEKQTNRTLAADLNPKLVATINGDSITEEDLEFYKLINRIQIAMNREADGEHLQGNELAESMKFWDNQEKATLDRNTLLTQIIRLRAVALLAKEKGFKATETEVKEEMEAVKQIYDNQPAALKMMKEYGEDRFWKKNASNIN